MEIQTHSQLASQKCKPCEGGVEACPLPLAEQQLESLPGWKISHNGQRIRKSWKLDNFLQALKFFDDVAVIAEEDAHHPDLHLEGYRHVWIEVWTHAIGGLSENDFILAAKIDCVYEKYSRK
jgi:4a-hydroxytetrahydrobiopterin dehydratase